MSIYVTAIDGMGSGQDSLGGALQNLAGINTNSLNSLANMTSLGEGIINVQGGHFAVTPEGGNMNVDVAIGQALLMNDQWVAGSTQTKYWGVFSNAIDGATIAANASGNPRIDVVCLRVNTAAAINDDGTGPGSIAVVQGTPGAVPAVPTIPDEYMPLAQVAVANGATSIIAANITDMREQFTIFTLGAEGVLQQGKIAVTTSSNSLIISIVRSNGDTPTAKKPVAVTLDNKLYFITSALTLTLTGGDTTNRFDSGGLELTGKGHNLFVYLGLRSTNSVIELGISRFGYMRVFSEFNSAAVTEDHYGLFSNGNLNATDVVTVIGRFRAISTFSTPNYNWSQPTQLILNKPTDQTELNSVIGSFTPQYTGFSVNPTNGDNVYQISGRVAKITMRENANGTSNATNYIKTAPFKNVALSSVINIGLAIQATNNGVALTNPPRIQSATAGASKNISLFPDSSGGVWTAANAKGVTLVDIDLFV